MKGKKVKTIEVFAVGTVVEFIDGGTNGIITQVCIQADCKVSYEVVWWSSNARNSGWVSVVEIKPVNKAGGLRIGFTA
jgi:hypothetical protein